MGLLKTAAKVAVASSVHGRVQRRQSERWAAQDAAAAAALPAVQDAPTPVAVAPAAPAPPAPPALSADDMINQFARLGELRTAGILTDAEFESAKARILAQ
ncbi:putative oligomerization/nucleic acid binding protein [Humibacillus xanthopallidus]|uniref:Putative oligomerization/nucleic acid binding protein n=1 Tax=Humibacillus xanthopallidus TaxID=412689 RepID=A0A543PPL3_9MICO|nr:SHOCT domain-containing protein [Humibacillus xanthopallidus]TQN46008.1 putative oligomerization/nucleic acid binding protein [Humibacillus xanthopallidus]